MTSFGPSAIVGLTALTLVFITTIPTLLNLLKRAKSQYKANGYDEIHKLYEDKDGVATEESQNQYSATVPKYSTLFGSIIGLATSIAIAVLISVNSVRNLDIENWLVFGSWVITIPIPEISPC